MSNTYLAFMVATGMFGLLAALGTGWFVSKLFRGNTIKEITETANEIIKLYENKIDVLQSDLNDARKDIQDMSAKLTKLSDRNELLEELLLKMGKR
jgi:Skp family chaperone for outer membrane proteins